MTVQNALPDRLISAAERREMIPYSDMHIWRLEKQGRFPRRIRIGPNRVAWRLSEILEWINARAAERDHMAPPKLKPSN
jgi:prophage regulatory protein